MNYLLVDLNEDLVSAWKNEFINVDSVEVIKGDITEVHCDAIVSPANSFGFMDGVVDYAISNRLGWGLQKQLQHKIQELPEGELLIGKALVIETGDPLIKYLISAPTMRVPMEFNISTSINAYLAMKAVLISVRDYEDIDFIAIPGFCTGTGKMNPEIAARQMYFAFQEIELGEKMKFNSFAEAKKYHLSINPSGRIFD